MVKVKVCGITRVEHAEAAVEAGADAIGFIFAESKRKITVETAKQISRAVPHSVKKVGVFVDSTLEEIERTAEEAGLDLVQLHGTETPEFLKSLSVPCFKALSIKEETDLNGIDSYPGSCILLDSGHGGSRGGNGTSFDWSYLKNDSREKRIILAGGINTDNVEKAIREVDPYMIDVSSGVETNGIKDIEKIKEFIYKAKNMKRMKEDLQ